MQQSVKDRMHENIYENSGCIEYLSSWLNPNTNRITEFSVNSNSGNNIKF